MADTPSTAMATIAVHEALIRQLVDGQERVITELRAVGAALVKGDARLDAIEQAQALCRALHDAPEDQAVRALPAQVAVMAEQLANLRMVVYGACGFALLGLLATLGTVMVKVLGQP